jgi:hypothetical protein
MESLYPGLTAWLEVNAKSSDGMAITILVAVVLVASVWAVGRKSERGGALALAAWGAGLWLFGVLLMVMA